VLDHAGLRYDIIKGQQNLATEQLGELLPQYDALIVGSDSLTSAMLKKSRLKIIAKHGVGIDNINLQVAATLGIIVCNVPASLLENAVTDFTLALFLTLGKRIHSLNNETKLGKWQKIVGINLPTTTLGIVGMGNIGKNLARKAVALGMTVCGWDINPNPSFAKQYAIKYLDLEALLKISDVVSLHIPLTTKQPSCLMPKNYGC
jgi:D-3-phosphoglycerate dehydrogenase